MRVAEPLKYLKSFRARTFLNAFQINAKRFKERLSLKHSVFYPNESTGKAEFPVRLRQKRKKGSMTREFRGLNCSTFVKKSVNPYRRSETAPSISRSNVRSQAVRYPIRPLPVGLDQKISPSKSKRVFRRVSWQDLDKHTLVAELIHRKRATLSHSRPAINVLEATLENITIA